ncbi:MAG: hypothetical protein LBL00_01040 [Endomicrobium sp.]|jgi:hemolysin activation/secretion protein|nr:hypothetical protein [Endomicrobium sp.]
MNIYTKSILLAFTIVAAELLTCAVVLGQSADYIERQIQQQHEQEREYKENIRKILETQRVREGQEREEQKKEEEKTEKEDKREENEEGYKFDKIEIKGNKIFSYKKIEKEVLKDFIGKPINKENVKKLQAMLSDFYVKRGYITVKVYFDLKRMRRAYNEESGKAQTSFDVIIEEGITGNIVSENISKKKTDKEKSWIGKFREKSRLFFAFPFKKGKRLNIKDFEQGLDQMNKLESNRASMEIAASRDKELETGYSDIIIINNQDPLKGGSSSGRRTTFVNVNYNNGGSKSTGDNVVNLSINQDNLLSINDNIYVNYSEDGDSLFGMDLKDGKTQYGINHEYKGLDFLNNDDKKKRYSKSLYGAFSFPFGYWTFNGSLNYAGYKSSVYGQYNNFHVTGETITQEYTIDRMIYRRAAYKLNIGYSVEIRDAESYIRDVKSETGSGRRSKMSVYSNNTIYTKFGTIMIRPSYHRGVKWFASKGDEDTYQGKDIEKSDPRLEYNMIKMYLYFNRRFNIPLGSKKETQTSTLPFYYTLTIDSQYSLDALYGINQFSAGGQYSVRGFKESIVSGDNGVYMRNDIRINLLEILPSKLSAKNMMTNRSGILLGESLNSILSKTELSVFYDFGYVENKYEAKYDKEYHSQDASMSGAGISVSYYGENIRMSLIYSKGLERPEYLEKRDGIKEEDVIYWKIGMKW